MFGETICSVNLADGNNNFFIADSSRWRTNRERYDVGRDIFLEVTKEARTRARTLTESVQRAENLTKNGSVPLNSLSTDADQGRNVKLLATISEETLH